MKRILATALAIAIILTLTGCGKKVERTGESEKDTSMFVIVENTSIWEIVYHKETKVMYAVSFYSHGRGNFTLLVNPDGTPMLWDGK